MEKKKEKRSDKHRKKNLGKLLKETFKSYRKLIKVEIEKFKFDHNKK